MAVSAPYATADDVKNELGDDAYLALVDRDVDGSPDTTAVEAALARASSIAEAYLARHLPLDETPTWLLGAVVDIAIFRLSGDTVSEAVRQRYEDAMKQLRDVQAGRAGVGFNASAAQLEDDIEIEAPEHVMTRDALRGLV